MPFEEAGAFPIAYISSDVAIRWQGRLEPGETLLVLGAAGGVGLTAVEIGKAMGARVIAGASTAEKLAVARDARRRRSRRLRHREAHRAGDGADGRQGRRRLLRSRSAASCRMPRCPRSAGAAACCSWASSGGVQQIPANRLLVKNRSALGCSLRYYRWHAPDKLRRSVEELLRWYGEGRLKPLRHPPPAARAERRGDPAPDRPQGATARSSSCRARGIADAAMEIRVEAHGPHVAVVTIDNQPRRNAMTRADDGGAGRPVGRARARSYRCIVLTGAGDRAFSSGADMAGDLSADPARAARRQPRPAEAPPVHQAHRRRGQRRLRGRRRRAAARDGHPRGGAPRALRAARGAAGRSIPSAAPPSSSSSRSATSTRWSSC